MDTCSIKIAVRHNQECILSNLNLAGTHSNYPFNLSSDVFIVVHLFILLLFINTKKTDRNVYPQNKFS